MSLSRAKHYHQYRGLTLSQLILEKIAELGEAAIGSFFPATYPEGRAWRRLLGLNENYRFKRETFSTLLTRLQDRGLVERRGTRQRGLWRLTRQGRASLSHRDHVIPPKPDGIGRLVIFDIPETERKKRDAIRYELANAGFTLLQKSVWYGERPLPQDFLEFVNALSLRPHLHIFSVREHGTLPSTSKHLIHDRELNV